MTKKEKILLTKEIDFLLAASKCPLSGSSESKEWQEQAIAIIKLIEQNEDLLEQRKKAIEILNKYDFDKFTYTKTNLKEIFSRLLEILGGK